MSIVPGNAQAVGDRENQQDSFGFSDFADQAFARHGGVLMVLCDGMGGLANGAAASRVAVDTVLAAYHRKQPSEPIPSTLERAVSGRSAKYPVKAEAPGRRLSRRRCGTSSYTGPRWGTADFTCVARVRLRRS
jgi:serine/threonine protein phosphatase PrpC